MKKLIKPASIAFYILIALVFFIIGLYFAGFIGAGKNQGLAGGAIVLGYGVLFGGLAFIGSFFIAYHVAHKWIVRCNWIVLVILAMTYGITHYRFLQNKKDKAPVQTTPPVKTTEPISFLSTTASRSRSLKTSIKRDILNTDSSSAIGLGFFKPNFYEYSTLYFYGNINWEKGFAEHLPQDSISLQQNQTGGFDLRSAPPYLWPAYHNTEYGEFYFKVFAVGYDFITVEVNTKTQQKVYVDKNAGELLYWPSFLLQLNTVSMVEEHSQPIRIKPLAHAGTVAQDFKSLRPLTVEGDWLQVALKNEKNQTVATGWLRWRKDQKLLIDYSISH
ncbi:hypothetical protein [Luteirhabdus pelagi]|uniref:hypothetical protein n=1 Tax=Luteirhabdus pelagi TaxID=2792783 RepID=UPI001939577F|nr:hypothetical protein [Luteirhabdus pelagi]